jgi:hypothetical protein
MIYRTQIIPFITAGVEGISISQDINLVALHNTDF